MAYFGAWRGNPLLADLPFKAADGFVHTGDHVSSWTERVGGPDADVSVTWSEFDAPFLVEFDPERSATGAHEMISLFVPARRADVLVNGTRSTGAPQARDMAGKRSSTAFLAFSETWLKAAPHQ